VSSLTAIAKALQEKLGCAAACAVAHQEQDFLHPTGPPRPRSHYFRRVAHGRWLVHIPGCDIAIDSIAIAAPPACLEPEDLAVASSNDCGERSTAFRTKGTPIDRGPRH
jgi:hypothetical protein